METGGETPSSSLSNAASSSSPSSGSGRHSAGAVFSFNIPLGGSVGGSQSDTETVDSQELLAVIGADDEDEEGDEGRTVVDLFSLSSHFLQEGSNESSSHSDTMLFLLPSGESRQLHGPSSAESPHLLVQRRLDTGNSPSENKENTAPNSPLVASANYKQGNYFRFPDVDGWPSGTSVKINADQLSSCSTPSDTLTLGILSPPDVLLPEAPRNSPMRRARLKSISLDSQSAKAVEETLILGMQEMCLQPSPQSELYQANCSGADELFRFSVKEEPQGSTHSFRNRNQLKIDLKQDEFLPDGSGVDSRQHPPTPKTPTLTQSRQKAISLDSDQSGGSKPTTEPAASCCVPTVSASVPTTPKRHLVLSTHRSHHHHHHQQQQHHHHHHQQQHGHGFQKSSHHFYYHQQQQQQYHHHHQQQHQFAGVSTNLMTSSGSSSASCRTKSRSTSEHLGSNLQRLKTVTLSVSNNNLKTLPEVMPLSDFGSNNTSPPLPAVVGSGLSKSSAVTQAMDGAAFVVSPNVGATTPSKGRSSLLQRRGSNHSLTLNLAGSVGDLSGSISHIAPSASGSGFGTKRGLLQRRGSNASLTLTIQGSDSALSRFNSHGSLNEGRVNRKSLLSVSNCNLRSSMDVSRLRGQPGEKASHHGKFFSSEENLNNKKLSYCHIDPIDVVGEQMDLGSAELVDDYDDDGVRQITTKPLSPQSTSEDFKIYLANIQYLQNASNVLHVDDIRDLCAVFNDLGAYGAREMELGGSEAAARLTSEQEKHLNVSRRKLREIQQEFWDLPTNHQEKPMVFGSQHKNRYKTILPNEHSRVILKPELGDPSRTEPYINANYIKGPTDGTHELNYIATQGPMANTVFDFWLMAMQDTAGELGLTAGNHTHNKSYSASFAQSHPVCPIIVAEDMEYREETPSAAASEHRVAAPSSSGSRVVGEKLYIVMLTNFIENGRPKCATYFPEKLGQSLCFYSGSGSESQCESVNQNQEPAPSIDEGTEDEFRDWFEGCVREEKWTPEDRTEWRWIKGLRRTNEAMEHTSASESCFIVRTTGLREMSGYSVRDLTVLYINGPARVVNKFSVEHYWFPDWPDHKSPGDLSVVLDFALDLLNVPGLTMGARTPDRVQGMNSSILTRTALMTTAASDVPKVVLPILHCSAGIGRTGCMAGILNALRQIIHSGTPQPGTCSDVVTVSSPSQSQTVDILGIVCNLRLQRGGMVQNSEQYELIHRVLCLYQQKSDESKGIFPAASFLQQRSRSD